MANKNLIRVNINYKKFIPNLGCYGPVKNILLTEAQINNIKRIIGEDKVEILDIPKKVITKEKANEIRRELRSKAVKIKKEDIAEIIEIKEVQPAPEVVEEPKVEEAPVEAAPEVVEEPKVEEAPVEAAPEVVEEPAPKPAPKRRRKTTAKKVEEAPKLEVEE